MSERPASWDRIREIGLNRWLDLHLVRLDPEAVVVEMPVAEPAFNSSGNLHGGAIATLIDVACGIAGAAVAGVDHATQSIVTADLHVRYLGRPKTERVRAHARVVRRGRQLIVVDCRVADTDDNVVAVADFSSMVVPRREPLPFATGAKLDAPDL